MDNLIYVVFPFSKLTNKGLHRAYGSSHGFVYLVPFESLPK